MADKLPKDMVDYSPGDIDGPHCGACENFIEPNHCEKVSGRIRSGGWCRLFAKRGAKKEDDDGVAEKAE